MIEPLGALVLEAAIFVHSKYLQCLSSSVGTLGVSFAGNKRGR
jgi:hypothetical protein